MANDDSPTRVAVIGGGCAALSAAFELTRPELGGRFAVTVYQMGWRLGGKGASGRGSNGRIEEHGLHLWMGYYENAFRLMRECYAELNQEPPAGVRWRFEDAFSPAPFNGAMDWSPNGGWLPWKVEFPSGAGMPGDPGAPELTVKDYLVRATKLARTLLATLPVTSTARDAAASPAWARPPTPDELLAAVTRLGRFGALAGLGALIEALSLLEWALIALPQYPQSLISGLLDAAVGLLRAELDKLVESSDEVRRLWEVVELILAAIRGSIRFRLAFDPRGFDAIDDYDSREWLRLNGASEGAINSAFIRALYDLAFAYEGGDPNRPAIAAGSALRGAFRAFFGYRGAFFWRMNAGMGDVVFAPLYQVLRRRGVRFEFFHKLTSVELSPIEDPSPHVAALHFDVQARPKCAGEYQPLVPVKGLPCWPSRPDFEQLVDGQALADSDVDLESQWDTRAVDSRRLEVSVDFDLVVLGVGLGVVSSVCGSILARDERWRTMVERVKSVPTQAFQLWLDRDAAALGWNDRTINLSGFVEPFDTWADMTHLGPREDWHEPPRSIAYFCNVLPEVGAPDTSLESAGQFVRAQHERVRDNAIRFLEQDVRYLWPACAPPTGFVWESLLPKASAPNDAPSAAVAQFATQYWTANVRPSDRYSQALPGSTRFRLSPLDRTYDNLTVAGDWTNSGINMGCVEAAVMSGLLAAHALSGQPALSKIVGYDHP